MPTKLFVASTTKVEVSTVKLPANATTKTGGTGALVNITAGAGGDAPSGSTNGNGGAITLQGGAPGSGLGTAGSYGNILLGPSGGNVGIGPGSAVAQLTIDTDAAYSQGLFEIRVGGNSRLSVSNAGQLVPRIYNTTNNDNSFPLAIAHKLTSGSATIGFGTGFQVFGADGTSSNTATEIGGLQWIQVAANASSAYLGLFNRQSGTTTEAFRIRETGDAWIKSDTGKLLFGATSGGDTNLYRSAAALLKTDHSLLIGNGANNDYLAFTAESSNPSCSAGEYKVWANSTDTKLKKCQNGSIADLDTTGGAGTSTLQNAYDATSGNTILATTGRNLAFTFPDVATDPRFTISLTGPDSDVNVDKTLASAASATRDAMTITLAESGGGTSAFDALEIVRTGGTGNALNVSSGTANFAGAVSFGSTIKAATHLTAAATDLALQPTTGITKLNTASVANELRVFENAASPANYTSLLHGTLSTSAGALAVNPATGGSLTSTVTKNAATGDEAAFDLAATINKATSGNYTGLKLTVTETSAPGAADKLLELLVGSSSKFKVDNGGTVTLAASQSLTSAGALAVDSSTTFPLDIGTTASGKTITIGNITGATSVTINSGSNGINIGDNATTKVINLGGNFNNATDQINIATESTAADTVNIGNTNASTILDIRGGTINFGDTASTKSIDIGGVTNSGTDTVSIATNSTAADTLALGNTNAATKITLNAGPNTTSSGTAGVMVGSATTDTTQVNFQVDSFSAFNETASTCSTTLNQGAIYYNTAAAVMRACVNGNWEDLVSTAALGFQLFGVVPDSGANPGDLAAVTGAQNGPCKVSVGANTTTVSWTACTAYSGGRKVLVTAGTASTATGTANDFSHLCLTGSGNQPALSARGTEVANLSTISMPSVTSPILCLADIKFTGTAATITQIYDTRTYTTTAKMSVSIGTTAPALGHLVQFTATKGVYIPMATLNGNNLGGIVVATTGATSTTTINAIIATNGPAAVKAITGTNVVGAYIFGSATAGYASTVATKPTEATSTIYNLIGAARTAWTGATACSANNDACAGSILTEIDKR